MDSISIVSKYNCCGCGACADICPKQCITMEQDKNGFFFPVIDNNICILCGRCTAVCPVLNDKQAKYENEKADAFAYISADDEIIKGSSSGGAFTLIMDAVAEKYKDFAIAGAAFCGTTVKHIIAKDISLADALKKSKYVQSDTFGIFKKVKELLDKGTAVLFSGTPCQVAALKLYVGKDYDNLLTVDIVCHGVPSQALFDRYLAELEAKYGAKVIGTEFRYKKDFDNIKPNPRTINVYFQNGKCINMDMWESEFLYAYYTGLIFRQGCANCKFACPSRPGDITLGDYWGIEKIHPEFNSLKGVSLVRFNSKKGDFLKEAFALKGTFTETKWSFACAENHQLSFPFVPHRNSKKFFRQNCRGMDFCKNVNICKRPDSIFKKILRKICNLF